MRNHLISCFESGKMTSFPKYRVSEEEAGQPNLRTLRKSLNSSSDDDWKIPRRSQRIRAKNSESQHQSPVKLSNRFEVEKVREIVEPKIPTESSEKKSTSDIVKNLSSERLSKSELSVLERG